MDQARDALLQAGYLAPRRGPGAGQVAESGTYAGSTLATYTGASHSTLLPLWVEVRQS
jgi:hypothetical protein